MNTLSSLVDSQHVFHPTSMPEKSDHISLLRRIAGIVLVALSIPLTFGLGTLYLTYWAHRKVVHVEEQNRTDLDERVKNLFYSTIDAEYKTSAQVSFEGAVLAIQRGDLKACRKAIGVFESENCDIANQLRHAAIEYDEPQLFREVNSVQGYSHTPINRASSAEMVHMIMDSIEEYDSDRFINWRGFGPFANTALHEAKNLEVAKALVARGAQFLCNNRGQTPLHTCKDPAIAAFFINEFGEEKMHWPDNGGFHPFQTVQNAKVQMFLIEKDADIENLVLSHKFNSISCAKSVKVAKKLVEIGLNPQFRDQFNASALFGPISVDVMRWLIEEHGLDINETDINGFLPIHVLHQHDIEKAKLLIGDRDLNTDWGRYRPRVLENLQFQDWLQNRK